MEYDSHQTAKKDQRLARLVVTAVTGVLSYFSPILWNLLSKLEIKRLDFKLPEWLTELSAIPDYLSYPDISSILPALVETYSDSTKLQLG